jgi:hypothetical protein
MTHFVSTLASYVMFEVLEIMWGQLVKEVKASCGLSDLIAAHDRYLSGILQKVCGFPLQTCKLLVVQTSRRRMDCRS